MKSSDDDTMGILLAAGGHECEEKMRETRKTLLDYRDVPRESPHMKPRMVELRNQECQVCKRRLIRCS